MNSRILVLGVFVIYSLICWNRYVCGIKQVCGRTPVTATTAPITAPYSDSTDTQMTAAPEDKTANVNSGTPEPVAPASKPAPEPEPDIQKVQVEELSDHVVIHFPYNSTRKVDNDAIDEYLTRLAAQLTGQGGKVVLTGHTDNVGDSKTNEVFAMRRAKNIRDILIAKGVKRNQITTKSYGERKPVATNDNPRGRYKNRRVEIRVQ